MRLAEATGRRAVALAEAGGPTVAELLTPAAFRNGLAVLQALGGSTNGVVHLAAIAGRLGRRLDLAELDELGRRRAGARRPEAVGRRLHGRVPRRRRRAAPPLPRSPTPSTPRRRRSAATTIGEIVAGVPPRYEDRIIRRRDDPVVPVGAIAVLGGNLAPARRGHQALGRLARAAAARGARRRLRLGRGHDAAGSTTRRPRSRPTTSSCCATPGRAARPGMPEAGYIPIPRRLARQGVKDMVRISDARMSGTAFGTVILHVTPEAADGGPLAVVRTGDRIRLDVPARRLELLVDADELAARLAALAGPADAAAARLRAALRPARAAGRRGPRLRLPERRTAMAEASAAAPLCLPPRPLAAAAARGAAGRHLRLPFPRLPRGPAARGRSASYTPTHGDARRLARPRRRRRHRARRRRAAERLRHRQPRPARGARRASRHACAASSSSRPTPPAPRRSPACTGSACAASGSTCPNRPGSPSTRSRPRRAWSARSAGTCRSWSAPGRSPTVAALAARHAMPVVIDHLALVRPDDAGATRGHRTAAPPRHRRRLRQALGALPAGAGARLPRPRPAGRAPGSEPPRAAALGHRLAAYRSLRRACPTTRTWSTTALDWLPDDRRCASGSSSPIRRRSTGPPDHRLQGRQDMAVLNEAAKGVYVIAVTPFADDGALDLASVDRMVDVLRGGRGDRDHHPRPARRGREADRRGVARAWPSG